MKRSFRSIKNQESDGSMCRWDRLIEETRLLRLSKCKSCKHRALLREVFQASCLEQIYEDLTRKRHEEDDLQKCEQHKFIEVNATRGITGAFSACYSDHKPLGERVRGRTTNQEAAAPITIKQSVTDKTKSPSILLLRY
ncbi:hypothetical protein NC653_027323 [Populus alba x Populus x berolinensis]|uniref:Uncharacterized protein n=1 Tax=Populus alba x Populus x berolinensis TaxID=444605 RepID=A0AAD6Q4X5_9ROSI|nr:hypothetical protein NC653_027323 [Populus alba x Populus x berolinensis]